MDSQTTAHQRLLEIASLSWLAVSLPLLILTGTNATFFVAHGFGSSALVIYALVVLLVPAVVAIAIEGLMHRIWPRSSKPGAVLRGSLMSLIVVPSIAAALGWSGGSELALFIGVAWVGYRLTRLDWVRAAVRISAVAPVAVLAWMLFISPASALLDPPEETRVATSGARGTSIVWLVFDQLPLSLMIDEGGSIRSDAFPNFERLAAFSTWFPNATTVASATDLAVTSALSGNYVPFDSLPVLSQAPVNLFTIMGSTHRIVANETVTQLCPDVYCTNPVREREIPSLLGDTLVIVVRMLLSDSTADRLVPETNDRWAGFGAGPGDEELVVNDEATNDDEVRARRIRGDDRDLFDEFLKDLVSSDGPSVYYLHLEKPHEPLFLLPDGRAYDHCACYRVGPEGDWPSEPGMAAQRLQRYLLQAMYVDHLLGRVLDVVEQGHLSEEAILVVMSDHGASLLPGSLNRKIVAENVHDVLPVPVFIRRAGQTMGEVEPRAVQLVDLLPTVLAELGVRVAEHAFDGEALFANEAARDPLLITSAGLQAPPAPPNPRSSALPGWLASLFPDPSNPFRWGPNADLIGTEVIRAETGQSAFVATLSSDSMVGPGDNRHVSAHVFGKLVGATQPVEMAVAVGDRVAGVGTTYEMDGWQLSLMIDPSLIPDEGSTVELFEISNGALMKVPLS